MKNTIAYSPLEFQFIGPYVVVFYIPKLIVMTKSAENIEKKIEAQLEKLKQLKAQKQAIEARERSKQKEQERKDDTRRKILLGSYLIKKMQSNEANKEKIIAELNEYLTEDRDRQLLTYQILRYLNNAKNTNFMGGNFSDNHGFAKS